MFTGSKLRLRVASSAILLNLLVDMKVDLTDTSSAQQILTGTVVPPITAPRVRCVPDHFGRCLL